MRELQTHDVFVALKVVRAAGVKDEIRKVAALVAEKEKIKIEDVGLEFIFGLFEKVPEAENAIYDLIGGILEIKPSEIRTMNPFELFEKLEQLKEFVSTEQAKRFFKYVAALMEKQK